MDRVEHMTRADLECVLGWAADEGWNPGLDDAEAFLAADPEGFFLKRVGGAPAAAVSVVNHSDDYAFLGLYICAPAFRGMGHGLDVWTAGLAHAGGRTVGLDGVPAQQQNYVRSGFVRAGRTIRYEGRVDVRDAANLRPMRASDIPAILALDAAQTGTRRDRYLSAWLTPTPTRQGLVIERNGAIAACGTVRACRTGAKIGPFMAHRAGDASDLMAGLARIIGRAQLFVDVPDSCHDFHDLLAGRGFAPVFETARMYRGAAPATAYAPFHGVATLELG